MNHQTVINQPPLLGFAQWKSNEQFYRELLWLALMLAFAYLLFLGATPLTNPDEGRYAEISREMVAYGDYVTPMLNGIKFLDKPILFYWAESISIHLFGVYEWSLRLVPAFFAWVCALWVFYASSRIFNIRTGRLSAVVTALSPLYFGTGHYINVDMMVASLISMSMLSFWLALLLPSVREQRIHRKLAFVFAALATLTKGLIGFVFPGAVVGLWLLGTGQWKKLRGLALPSGALCFLVITLPWFIVVQIKNPEFFDYFFIYQHVERYLETGFNNAMPFWFYIPVFIIGFAPWSLWLTQLFVYIKNLAVPERQACLYLVIWVAFVLIFFSAPTSKILSYIVPVFPAASILMGKYFSDHWHTPYHPTQFKLLNIFTFFSVLLAITLPIAAHTGIHIYKSGYPYLVSLSLILGLYPFYISAAYVKKGVPSLFQHLAIYIFLVLIHIHLLVPAVVHNSTKSIATVLKSQVTREDEVISFYEYFYDLPLYIGKRLTILHNWHPKGPIGDNYRSHFIKASQHQDTSPWLIDPADFVIRWKSAGRKFLVFPNKESDFLVMFFKKHGLTYYAVTQNPHATVISNQRNAG